MTTRLLRADEWPLVAASGLPALLAWCPPDSASVVAVEQGGQIVGCCAVLHLPHLEGVWIAPAHRGKAAVMRRLVAATFTEARRGCGWAFAGAASDAMHRVLRHLRGRALPLSLYVIPVGER